MKQLTDYLYHETERGTLYCGDCLEIIKQLPDESIDCCITSPPYWGLRDYGTAEWIGGSAECDHKGKPFATKCNVNKNTNGSNDTKNQVDREFFKDVCGLCGAVRKDRQLGLEKTPEEYTANMVNLFREVRRVLKKDGVLWLNLGDSYNSHSCGNGNVGGIEGKRANKQDNTANTHRGNIGLKDKDLVGIPWRVAFALQAGFCTCSECGLEMRTDLWATRNGHKVCIECLYNGKKDSKVIHSETGWYLRQDIIWHKPNPMPESVTDRCTKAHEYIFLLTKSAKYYYDHIAIQEPANYDGRNKTTNDGSVVTPEMIASKAPIMSPMERWQENANGEKVRNKRSVWTIDSKYENMDIEAEHRQGMHRERGNGTVEKRNLPDKTEFIDTLRANFTISELVEKTGEPKTLIEHWFRRDECFAYPTKEVWGKVKTDLFPELLDVWYESDAIEKNSNGYRNKRSVWTVTTKPFKEAHFATFPPDLILPCVLTSPKEVCCKCGKPYHRIKIHSKQAETDKTKSETIKLNDKPYAVAEREGIIAYRNTPPQPIIAEYLNSARKQAGLSVDYVEGYFGGYKAHHWFEIGGALPDINDWLKLKELIDFDEKYDVVMTQLFEKPAEKMTAQYETIGWQPTCHCNAETKPAVILDPFFGSGTTGMVAVQNGRNYVGIDLNEKYCEIAKRRIETALDQTEVDL